MSIEFVDEPPRHASYKYNWNEIIADLKGNPGRWAVITGNNVKGTVSSANGTRHHINAGHVPGMPRGEFEATTRGNVIYARYVGNPNSEGGNSEH